MAELDQIISVSITRQTQSIATASFNIPLVLVESTAFAERTREYTSLSAVAEDFPEGTVAHKMASQLFGQEVRPPKIIVGRKATEEETWQEALNECEADNSEWFALVCE